MIKLCIIIRSISLWHEFFLLLTFFLFFIIVNKILYITNSKYDVSNWNRRSTTPNFH